MYGLSYHMSLIKKEAKLVAYDKFRTNSIVYDIGDKRFTSSHNIYQYKGYNNRKEFIKKTQSSSASQRTHRWSIFNKRH